MANSGNGGSHLPEGSSYFQEVMAELHPDTPPQSPGRTRRRSHARSKHLHPGTSPFRPKTDSVLVEEEEGEVMEEEEEEEGEKEVRKGGKEGPERLILHGKCHCYFVENGNVTGLADFHCHHEHRSSTTHTLHIPSSSPRIPRKATPTISPSSSPKVSRSATPSVSPSCSPHVQRRTTLTPSPEESPTVKPKFQTHRHQQFLPPHVHLEEFWGRSHSDTAVMARLSSSKKASRAAAMLATGHSKLSPTTTPPPTFSIPDGSQATLRWSPTSSLRQIASDDDGDDLAVKVSTSLRVSSPRHSRGSQEFPSEGEGSQGRKLSPRAVSSEQLHYLYDQFLHNDSRVPPGERPQ